jgi:hypothetical protein
MPYTTKTTRLGSGYGCRVFLDGALIVEGRCADRSMIGATFRDLLRTLDKSGGDEFTSAARARKFREGNTVTSTRHIWPKK